MRTGFRVHRKPIGARLAKRLDEGIDRRNHQMHVERSLGVGPDRLDHHRSDGDIGNEVAVHHIDMDEIGARLLHRFHFRTQRRKVGGKNGWCDSDGHSSIKAGFS